MAFLFLSLSLISFFPSYQIVSEVRIPSPFSLNKEILAGAPLLLPMDSDMEQIYINETTLSPIYEKGVWFGVADLYAPTESRVLGYKKLISGTPGKFWESPRIEYFEQSFKVKKPTLKQATNLRIPASVWERLVTDTEVQRKEDQQKSRDILGDHQMEWGFSCPQMPVKNITTSQFASPRNLPNGRSYYHSGMDLRARTGDPIFSVSQGLVRLADHMIIPGNNIIIDHGGGLFSRYMHMSEFKVKAGDEVKPGQLLGYAGSTGRVEAAHLHFEMIWKGHYANPSLVLQAWNGIQLSTDLCGS